MQFRYVDTAAAYRRLFVAPDAAARATIFGAELAAPFAGLARFFGQDDPVAAFAQWGMMPEQFAPERHAEQTAKLDALLSANAWSRAALALEEGIAAFARHGVAVPLDRVVFALLLADLPDAPGIDGYTGFGGIPGLIMTIYGDPNPANLARVEAVTAHELHHNLFGALFPEQPMIASLGSYMVGEGLAESFAAELYGPEAVGPWVTAFDQAQLESSRAIFREALDVTSFDVVRRYIFGGGTHTTAAGEVVPIAPLAGYALGYAVVQAYVHGTGRSVVEATLVPATELIAESQFFT